MGKFKNKKVVVKSIDWNEKGDLLINGRPALKFRIVKKGVEEDVNVGKDKFRTYIKVTKAEISTIKPILGEGVDFTKVLFSIFNTINLCIFTIKIIITMTISICIL